MKVVIIDYGAGNVFSVTTALQRLGVQAVLSSDVRLIVRADRVIFPGVGQAAAAMKQLKDKGLDRIIPQLEMPVLGICLGMQLMCSRSEEGEVDCLGIFDVPVKRFFPQKHEDKVVSRDKSRGMDVFCTFLLCSCYSLLYRNLRLSAFFRRCYL